MGDYPFQSTLSVRRATRHLALAPLVLRISIHALRKESDKAIRSRMALWLFQSTLSVRRATVKDHPMRWLLLFQSTLSVRRATRSSQQLPINPTISIHALRKESDSSKATTSKPSSEFQSTLSVRRATGQATGLDTMTVFQSTLSVRRATVHDAAAKSFQSISIHALRKESDKKGADAPSRFYNFNPRSP